MKKVEDYRQHAVECRIMANRIRRPEDKDMLMKMAATWESLAVNRETQIARQRGMAKFEGRPVALGPVLSTPTYAEADGRFASSAANRVSASAMSSRKPDSARASFANRRMVRIRTIR